MTKICCTCRVLKSIGEFNKDSSTRDGLRGYCRDCGNSYWRDYKSKYRDKRNARARELRQANVSKYRAQVRRSELKTKYGLTPEDFSKLLADQNNCCACCGDEFVKTPDIDHKHDSNPPLIRGLLCTNCNNGLGRFKDSIIRLQKAISYLQKFS